MPNMNLRPSISLHRMNGSNRAYRGAGDSYDRVRSLQTCYAIMAAKARGKPAHLQALKPHTVPLADILAGTRALAL